MIASAFGSDPTWSWAFPDPATRRRFWEFAVHRGRGLGMALLRENLARIDAQRMPAYLESSNQANNHRYESVGFVQVAAFRAPGGGPMVTGMWREPLDQRA